jgi:DNA invertase Pin-like site-specific DNA recombinase
MDLSISNLIKNGLIKAKERGMTLGRPIGTTQSNTELLEKHGDIIACLRDGYSIRSIARMTNKGGSTVQRVKKIYENGGVII